MNLFKRKPKEETVSKAEHERIVAGWADDLRETRNRLARELQIERNVVANLVMQKRRLRDRLAQIASQETPGANATVKRMAAIARGEEPQSRDKQQAEVGA